MAWYDSVRDLGSRILHRWLRDLRYLLERGVIMSIVYALIGTLVFAVLGPVIGCLLAGLDRKITARMQGRVGPPLLQPYYDVRKLFGKERVSVNTTESAYVVAALVFALLAGGIFFSGGNLLMCVFVITLSSLFFIVAAYSSC